MNAVAPLPATETAEGSPPLPPLDAYARGVIRFKAWQLAHTPPFSHSDRRDIEQELTVGLMLRARRFNPQKGRWAGFVQRVVANIIVDMVRDATSQCRDHRTHSFSLNETVALPDGERVERHEIIQEVADTERPLTRPSFIELRIDLFVAIDNLPEDLRVVCLRLQEESVQEISRSLGRSREAIYRRLRKARALLAQAGLRDYLPNNHRGDIQ